MPLKNFFSYSLGGCGRYFCFRGPAISKTPCREGWGQVQTCRPGKTRAPKGAYSTRGRSRHLLVTHFSEALLRTPLRTLFYCKTHKRPPSQNPSENPFPRTLLRTLGVHPKNMGFGRLARNRKKAPKIGPELRPTKKIGRKAQNSGNKKRLCLWHAMPLLA